MYTSSGFLNSKWSSVSKKNVASLSPLSHVDAANLNRYLEEDGKQVAYSSIVSLADAIRGLEAGFHSWSTVKLYYCLFYTLRSILCFGGTAIFYSNGKPFKIQAVAGNIPESVNTSSSHKAVMQIYGQNHSNSLLLSQTIGLIGPFEWMQIQRETVNYRQAKFSEPNALTHFRGIMQSRSIRQAISTYLNDMTLSFDEDHAILAYPILALTELKNFRSAIFEDEDRERLKALLTDSLGRLTAFDRII